METNFLLPDRDRKLTTLEVDRQGTFSSVQSDGLDEGLPRRTARWDVDDDVDEPREMMTPEERPKTAKELRKEQLEDQKRSVQANYNGQEKGPHMNAQLTEVVRVQQQLER